MELHFTVNEGSTAEQVVKTITPTIDSVYILAFVRNSDGTYNFHKGMGNGFPGRGAVDFANGLNLAAVYLQVVFNDMVNEIAFNLEEIPGTPDRDQIRKRILDEYSRMREQQKQAQKKMGIEPY